MSSARQRHRLSVTAVDGRRVQVEDQCLRNFSANDYLGLANHPQVLASFTEALSRYGMSARSSAYISGYSPPLRALEQELAEQTERAQALVFTSGQAANLAVVSALCTRHHHVLADRFVHASLLDGVLLARAHLLRYPHADAVQATERLANSNTPVRMLLTESLFSMDGDIAPLAQLASACQQYNTILLVDDAHGFGVYGARRAGGLLEESGLGQQQVPLLVATFGKAIGLAGAFVAGDAEYIEVVEQRGRSGIYTTAMMPAQAEAIRTALRVCRQESWRRERLQQNISYFCHCAQAAELKCLPSTSAIQLLPARDSQQCVDWGLRLRQQGFLVAVIRPPTVPENGDRLRISLSAVHTEKDIQALVAALAALDSSD